MTIPPAQLQYWMTHTAAIVDSLAQSLSPSLMSRKSCSVCPLGIGGEHLSGPQQELCVPPSVLDSLTMVGDPMRTVEWTTSRFCCSLHQPFREHAVETPVASCRSECSQSPGSPIVVSHPFVTCPLQQSPRALPTLASHRVFGQHQLLAKPSSSFSGRVVPVGAGGGLGRGMAMVGPRAQKHEAPKGGAPQRWGPKAVHFGEHERA